MDAFENNFKICRYIHFCLLGKIFLEIFSCSGRKVEQLIKLAKHINFLDLIICWTAMMCFDKVIFKTRDFAKNRIDSHTFCGHINTDGDVEELVVKVHHQPTNGSYFKTFAFFEFEFDIFFRSLLSKPLPSNSIPVIDTYLK